MGRVHVKAVWIRIGDKIYYGDEQITVPHWSLIDLGVDVECDEPPCPSDKNKIRWWLDELYNGSTNIDYGEVWAGSEDVKEWSFTIKENIKLPEGKYRFCATSYVPPDYGTSEKLKCVEFEVKLIVEKCPCDIVKQVFTSPDEVINANHALIAFNIGASTGCVDYIYNNIGKMVKDVFPECYGLETIEIVSFKVNPTEVNTGEEVEVTAMLQGIPESSWTAELYVDDSKVDEETVTLGYDGKGMAYFTTSFNYAGEYNVKVCLISDNMRVCSDPITVTVREKIGVKPEIVSFGVNPTEIEEGETVTVSATVKNVGDETGTFKIYTVVNGSIVEGTEIEVTLSPDEEYEYTEYLEMPSAGSYNISVCVEYDEKKTVTDPITVTVKEKEEKPPEEEKPEYPEWLIGIAELLGITPEQAGTIVMGVAGLIGIAILLSLLK